MASHESRARALAAALWPHQELVALSGRKSLHYVLRVGATAGAVVVATGVTELDSWALAHAELLAQAKTERTRLEREAVVLARVVAVLKEGGA